MTFCCKFTIILVLVAFACTVTSEHLRGANNTALVITTTASSILPQGDTNSVTCRLTIMHTSYAKGEEPLDEEHDIICIPIIDDQASEFTFPIQLPEEFLVEYYAHIQKGTMLVSVSDAKVTDTGLQVGANANFYAMRDVPRHLRHLVTTSFTTGTKTMAVIRLSTEDSSPTSTLAQMKSIMYDGNVTIFKQYNACSYGKLNYVLSSKGFLDFKLQGKKVSDFSSPELLVEEAQRQLAARIASANTLADTVVMCLPPGTPTSWIGKAPLNHWRAMFNDQWCLSISNLMHEIGHLMGLLHAGRDGNEYADTVGYMSWGLRSPTYPRKCYNGEKSWDLGWYSDCHLKYTPNSSNQRVVNIAAVTDYKLANATEFVIVNIDDRYFLTYNRMESFNDETEEKKNQVTVHERLSSRSDSVAGVSAGDQYKIPNYKGSGMALIIKACKRFDRSGKADVMKMSIGLGKTLC